MKKSQIFTIPNFLSAYRLLSFPFLLTLAVKGIEKPFVILLVINLATDILDGFIARRFNMQTELGARLDSIADIGTYILAITGVFVFKWDVILPYISSFSVFLIFYLATLAFSLIKFGRFTSFHLYSSKIGGYMQGLFFFLLFVFGFYEWYYYLMITWGILSFVEHLSIQVLLPELRSNLKGLYWVLQNKSNQ